MTQPCRAILIFALAAITVMVAGCRPPTPPPPAAQPRIVSLSPAISRMLVDLDMGEFIVGRTPWCSSVDAEVAIVGDLMDASHEMLARLRPTHLLVQPPASGVSAGLTQAAESLGASLHAWHIDSLDDVERVVLELPAAVWATGDPRRAGAAQAAAAWSNDLARVLTPRSGKQEVLLVAGVDPVLAAGEDTYLGDILQRLGGINALQRPGWVELTMEDITRINPATVILVRDGGDRGNDAFGPIADLEIDAVSAEGRLLVINERDALLPSTSAIDTARAMRNLLALTTPAP